MILIGVITNCVNLKALKSRNSADFYHLVPKVPDIIFCKSPLSMIIFNAIYLIMSVGSKSTIFFKYLAFFGKMTENTLNVFNVYWTL